MFCWLCGWLNGVMLLTLRYEMRKTSGFLRAVGLFYFVIHVCTTFPDLTFRFLIFFYCDHSALGLNFLKTMQIFVKTLTGKCE
jgi:hypothetical protein